MEKEYERMANVVTHFLELNRGRQFDFDLLCDCFPRGAIWMNRKASLFSLLAAESARWRHVTLDICHSACIALYQLKDNLPSMQSLQLSRMSRRENNHHPDVEDAPIDMFT